ncbi:licodione synthase [Ziziphus jujuba]|uniref:Licodione synthase n=1 Tax=Ziziphus jujuba TaxID=326968 RepID=A0A6P3Z8N1_ZIZJJ|nr:licodione synthase [Ziziphus jujuba]
MVVELLTLFLLVALLLRFILLQPNNDDLPPTPFALPIIGHFHLLGPLIHRSLHNLSLRYGPLFSFRLGSVPCIVVSTPDLAKQFLKTNELSFISHAYSIAISRLTYDSSLAFAPYGPYWKFIKKLTMNELLGSRPINNFLSLRARENRRLLIYLAKKSELGEAVNLTEELPKLSNSIIAHMILGTRCSSMEGRVEEARTVIRDVTKIFGEFNLSDYIWFCRRLDLQGFGKRIEDIHKRFDTLLEKIIAEREEFRKKKKEDADQETCNDQEEEEVKDFLDILLDITEDDNAEITLTRLHIKALVMDFFTAGTDTTGISTEWALAEIINHPKVLEKAREEIDRVVGKKRIVGESDGPNLPYMHAIIKETLRLHPPVPLVTRRCVEACKIEKYMIPKNTMLFVNAWAIGRDAKYWENPLEFCPERFLENRDGEKTSQKIDVKGQHFQVLPFGSGRRICPGMNLALQMLPGLLAGMVQCFDWKVVGGKTNDDDDDHHQVLKMDERPGMTAPRAHDLVCVPVARFSLFPILDP